MNKKRFEKMCRKAGLSPERRTHTSHGEVFIADGWMEPHKWVHFRRFGLGEKDFPLGCYVAMWSIADGEDNFLMGGPLFFEPGHDPDIPFTQKRKARASAAEQVALGCLQMREDARGTIH